MSEKSPAVLQTNRNIWNFFQLYGNTEIGSSPCCPSLRDLHVWLLSGAISDNTRCHTISEHRANIPAFCFMITSTLFTSASEIFFAIFFHVKGFLEVGHNIHSLWNENTSCVQDGKKNPWLSRKLYELIKNKSTHYACYSAKWKIPSLLLRLVGCFVCSRHLFPVSSTFSSLVQLGIKY